MGYARWIGAAFGGMAGGVFGALAGYALGTVVETLFSTADEGSQEPHRRVRMTANGERNSFLMALMILSAHIIQADGKIMHSEMEFVRRMLRANFGAMAEVQGEEILRRLFERRKQQGESAWSREIMQCCDELASAMTLEQRTQLLALLSEIAKADGSVHPDEVEQLKLVANYLRVGSEAIDQLLNLGENSLEAAYKVLGVAPDATDDEVRKAYRRMALQYHPDKVANLGDDVKAAAEKKFKELGRAKDLIWAARGM